MIRVVLPAHLRRLARVDGEVKLEIVSPVTPRSILDAGALAELREQGRVVGRDAKASGRLSPDRTKRWAVFSGLSAPRAASQTNKRIGGLVLKQQQTRRETRSAAKSR